jgi:hypothetical protein
LAAAFVERLLARDGRSGQPQDIEDPGQVDVDRRLEAIEIQR